MQIAPQTAEQMNQALKRPVEELRVINGNFTVKGFGPKLVEGADSVGNDQNDWQEAVIVGQGRNSTFWLHPDATTGQIELRNQSDWHDGVMEKLSFIGNQNGEYLLNLSGYSNTLRDIHLRGGPGQVINDQKGVRIFDCQHWNLHNVQSERMKVGIHLDNVVNVTMTGCNIETCEIGVLVTKSSDLNQHKGRAIVIDQLYAEKTQKALQVENCSVKCGPIVISERNAFKAIEGIGCHNSQFDMSQGSGQVHFDEQSHNNQVIVSVNDHVRIYDSGVMNEVRTVSQPLIDFPNPDWDIERSPDHDGFEKFQSYTDILAGEVQEIEYRYRITKQANLHAEFYDTANAERFNFRTGEWGTEATTLPLPFVTNQDCVTRIPLKAGGKNRSVQLRVHLSRADRSVVNIWLPRVV